MNINKTKIIVSAIFVFSIILFSGCTPTGGGSPEKTYKVGTDGLVLQFSKSNPTSVYEEEEFGTSMFIKNVGSTNVAVGNPALLSVIYDTYRLSIKDGSPTSITGIYLDGKSQYLPTGGEAPVEFYFTANKLTGLREGATTEITYNLCYPYATEFTTATCIDTKTANNADDVVACKAEPYTSFTGQGGPIVVTRIEPEIMLQKDYIRPQYKIYVENRGNGYVMNKPDCNIQNIAQMFGSGYNDVSGRVTVEAELSGQMLDCGIDGNGIMRLSDSESVITCSLPRENTEYSRTKKNYLTTLSIRISYTYVLLEKQEIEIKRNDLVDPESTAGFCNSYQVEVNGKCVEKCTHCSKNPNDYRCFEGIISQNINFKPDFACKCDRIQCNEKEPKGNCIKGNYCPTGVYCCNTVNCNATQIEYNGGCLSLCEYCARVNPDDSRCTYKGAAQEVKVLSGFTCRCDPNQTENNNFIPDSSYCDNGLRCCG